MSQNRCSRTASRPRFRRPAPGYSLRQHHNREEARVASMIFGKDLTAETAEAKSAAAIAPDREVHEEEDKQDASLRPQQPPGPKPNGRRPGPRRAKPVDPPSPATDVEAWTPLRGSDSTAQLLPKAPAEPPPPAEGGRRLRRPRQQGTPVNHSRFVFTFPVADEKAPVAVSAEDVMPTVPDDDSTFRATVSTLRSTGGALQSHSVPPLRGVPALRHTAGWSSDWVVQNSKPWPPRYHVGLPPLGKEASSPAEHGELAAHEDDAHAAHAEVHAPAAAPAPASALDNAERNASPDGNGSDDAANHLGLSARSRKSALSHAHSPSSERARIHLPPVRQMRFAPLTLKSKREAKRKSAVEVEMEPVSD